MLFRAFFIFSSLPWEKIKKKIARTKEKIHHAAMSITITAKTNNIIFCTESGPYVVVIGKSFYCKDLLFLKLFSCCFWFCNWCICLIWSLCCGFNWFFGWSLLCFGCSFSFCFCFCSFFFCLCCFFLFYSLVVNF